MTNITELKEKLTKWSEDSATKEMNHIGMLEPNGPTADGMILMSRWQHSQDAKTITALLSIIEDMQKALVRCSKRKIYFKDGGQVRYESGSTTTFYKDEEWCESEYTDETLTATKQKLKNLTEEK